jgi:hypothetical protein
MKLGMFYFWRIDNHDGECGTPEHSRFPAPWIAQDLGACFVVKDGSGQKLGYFYYEEEPGRRSAAKMLTRDEARQIAVNFAKSPELLAPKKKL